MGYATAGSQFTSAIGEYFPPIIILLLILLGLILLFVLPIIPARIARNKGYGFIGFYILGFFFFFIALIVALCLSDKDKQVATIANAMTSNKKIISHADELKKYNELLSQEEFDNIKKQLINTDD